MTYVDSPAEQLYTNVVKPYFRAPHLLIGFPTRYAERGWSDSMRELPELDNRGLRSKASDRYGMAVTEGLFMASRDGVKFKRWNEAFLRPGIERDLARRGVMGARHRVESFVSLCELPCRERIPRDEADAVRLAVLQYVLAASIH